MHGAGAHALAVLLTGMGHDGVREAVEQARFLEAGSARWWQVITAARTACARHFASEERDLLTLPGSERDNSGWR